MIVIAKSEVATSLLMLTNKKVPKETEKPANIRKNQNSRISSPKYFPFIACHILVMKEGIIIIVIAVSMSITNVKHRRLIVGKPMPIIPLTIPAKANTNNTNKVRFSMLSIGGSFLVFLKMLIYHKSLY